MLKLYVLSPIIVRRSSRVQPETGQFEVLQVCSKGAYPKLFLQRCFSNWAYSRV